MVVAIGDIVEVRQLPGQKWAVIGPHPQDARRWRVRRDGDEVGYRPTQGRTVGLGDLVVLGHPQFSPGQIVWYRGREAEVLADHGDTVALCRHELRPRNLDRLVGPVWREPTYQLGEYEIARGELVAENLDL